MCVCGPTPSARSGAVEGKRKVISSAPDNRQKASLWSPSFCPSSHTLGLSLACPHAFDACHGLRRSRKCFRLRTGKTAGGTAGVSSTLLRDVHGPHFTTSELPSGKGPIILFDIPHVFTHLTYTIQRTGYTPKFRTVSERGMPGANGPYGMYRTSTIAYHIIIIYIAGERRACFHDNLLTVHYYIILYITLTHAQNKTAFIAQQHDTIWYLAAKPAWDSMKWHQTIINAAILCNPLPQDPRTYIFLRSVCAHPCVCNRYLLLHQRLPCHGR